MANLKPEEYFKNEVDAAISQTGAKSTGSTPIRSSRLRFLETPGFDDKTLKDIPASVDFAGQNDRVIFLSMNKKGNVRMMTFRILNKEGTIAKPEEEIVSIDLDMDFPPVDLTDYVKKILGRKYEDILTEDPTKADQFIENFVTKSLNGGIKAFFVDKIEIVQTPWDPNTVPPQEVKKVEETPAATTTAPADQVTKVDDTTTPSDVSGVVPEVKKLPLRISIAGTDLKINAKTDLPSFYVFLGAEKVNGDELSEYDELDPEYTEGAFEGMSESEFEAISGKIEVEAKDSYKLEDYTVTIPKGVDIQKFSDESKLYELAGEAARKLGKNGRVTTENMKKSYNGAIHGLCPQGTLAMVVALTGVWGLGKLNGNADWFAWKDSGTGGGPQNLAKKIDGVSYYNDKVQVTKKDGSWNGTYIKDSSQWQIGDVIAMGYTARAYGHIQVWTGFSWQSDFKQGKNIQQNNVNGENVALWRLNSNGIAKVKTKSGAA